MIQIKHRYTQNVLIELQIDTLRDANLRGANLRGANLWGADLRDANLWGANLRGANLRGATNLRDANLRDADLRDADLQGADLRGANLWGANLRDANLWGANLRGADLRDAKIENANFGPHSILPEGDLIVYKKLDNGVICKLKISANVKRVSSLIGRKCRAESAEVLEGEGNSKIKDNETIHYAPGLIVKPDSFDADIRVECSHGVHFFITRQEAEEF